MLGLRLLSGLFSSFGEWGLLSSFSVYFGRLIVVASLVAKQALGAQALVVVAHRLSFSVACELLGGEGEWTCSRPGGWGLPGYLPRAKRGPKG